ncbi:MAG: RNA polymerase sigma factor RpoD/SigA [Bacteroidales bacterium]|jgi:RNA polymerase primary sigma factor|nr:RNA polymerase sigma factor RpoD/SigA [Bacteroidales bacterium]
MRQLKITRSITDRSEACFDKYLQDISREQMITPEEEVVLAKRIREGDQIALEKLCTANLRFVVSVAKQYQNQGLSLQDLVNEGNVGLIKAAKRFDETRGFKFISYAVWWIRQSILQAIAEQSRMVRLPLNQVGLLSRIRKVQDRLEQEFERSASINEIAERMELSTDRVSSVMKVNSTYVSMDAPLIQDEDTRLIDVFVSDDVPNTDNKLLNESLFIEIERSLATLSEKESLIIRMFFGLGMLYSYTIDEIAMHTDLSGERVRQIKESALRKLKGNYRSRLLKNYLGE